MRVSGGENGRSVCFSGRVAALRVGMTAGWFSPDGTFTAEDVAAHLPEVIDSEGMFASEFVCSPCRKDLDLSSRVSSATACGRPPHDRWFAKNLANHPAGHRALSDCGVQSGHAGEPTMKPSVIWATIRGPLRPLLS